MIPLTESQMRDSTDRIRFIVEFLGSSFTIAQIAEESGVPRPFLDDKCSFIKRIRYANKDQEVESKHVELFEELLSLYKIRVENKKIRSRKPITKKLSKEEIGDFFIEIHKYNFMRKAYKDIVGNERVSKKMI